MSRYLHYLYFLAKIRSESTLSHLTHRVRNMHAILSLKCRYMPASTHASSPMEYPSRAAVFYAQKCGPDYMSDCFMPGTTQQRATAVMWSLWRLATCLAVRDSNPIGRRDLFVPVQTGPEAHPASCNEYPVFPGGKAAGAWC